MALVYILTGSSGRYYIGSTVDLDSRFAQHLRGHTHTTKRLGLNLQIAAKKEFSSLHEARLMERGVFSPLKNAAGWIIPSLSENLNRR